MCNFVGQPTFLKREPLGISYSPSNGESESASQFLDDVHKMVVFGSLLYYRHYYHLFFLVCPGNVTNPCSGHGACDDGKTGSGHCQCDANFTGTACEKCILGKYGSNCTGGEYLFS